MEKTDVLRSAPNAPPAAKPASLLRRHWDFLAVLLLMVASLPVTWLSPHALIILPRAGMFDDHWVFDTPFKTARGIWFGRDVAFPYGPLFQWLFSLPSRAMGLSMAAIYTTFRTPLLWCTFLFGYLALRLLLPEQPPWKRFLLLLLLCYFWAPWDGRTAFDILLFAVFLRGWYAVQQQRLNPVFLGCGACPVVRRGVSCTPPTPESMASRLCWSPSLEWPGKRVAKGNRFGLMPPLFWPSSACRSCSSLPSTP